METTGPSLSELLYKQQDLLTFGYEPNMSVPTDVRTFAAELAEEVLSLSDEEVLITATEMDEAEPSRPDSETLGYHYERWMTEPARAFEGDPDLIQAFALRQVRFGIISRRFQREYKERFPERCEDESYLTSEPYLQGNVLAYRTAGEYLAAHHPLVAKD